jgi:hypothetical protein
MAGAAESLPILPRGHCVRAAGSWCCWRWDDGVSLQAAVLRITATGPQVVTAIGRCDAAALLGQRNAEDLTAESAQHQPSDLTS